MSINWSLFILWIITSVFALIFPVVFFIKYFFLAIKNFIKYIREHASEMKAIKLFQKDNFLSKIKQWDKDATPIFSTAKKKQQPKITHKFKEEQKEQLTQKKEPMVDKKDSSPSIDSHSLTKKKRKNKLESLKAQAHQYKTRWQFDEYEKILIEWMAIEDTNWLSFKKMLADWYFSIQNFKKALTLLKQILAQEPKNHKSLWQVGEIHLEKWEFDVAKMLVQKAIDSAPQNPKYYITMVEILYNIGDLHHAIALMHKVVKLRPTNVSYLMGLANLLEQAWDQKEAQTYYLKVVHIDPSNEKARKKLKLLKNN